MCLCTGVCLYQHSSNWPYFALTSTKLHQYYHDFLISIEPVEGLYEFYQEYGSTGYCLGGGARYWYTTMGQAMVNTAQLHLYVIPPGWLGFIYEDNI